MDDVDLERGKDPAIRRPRGRPRAAPRRGGTTGVPSKTGTNVDAGVRVPAGAEQRHLVAARGQSPDESATIVSMPP